MGEARRGVPVLLRGAGGIIAVLPVETATAETLAEFLRAISGGPLLVLARALGGQAPASSAAFALPADLLVPEILLALADPSARPRPGLSLPAAARGAPPPDAAAALQLAKLARLLPAVLIGAAAPVEQPLLAQVAAEDVLAYSAAAALALVPVAEARVPLEGAEDARLVAFRPPDGGIEHLAIVIGAPEQAEAPLVRVHSECFTGDLLGSRRCDCGPQLHQAIRRMAAEGAGVLLYMAQEGRGIGLVNKLRAYRLQDAGMDTLEANHALGFDADERSFAAAATMLRHLGIARIRLLTNNPDKIAGLAAHGIEVAGRVSHAIAANGENDLYLQTKKRRFGHLLA